MEEELVSGQVFLGVLRFSHQFSVNPRILHTHLQLIMYRSYRLYKRETPGKLARTVVLGTGKYFHVIFKRVRINCEKRLSAPSVSARLHWPNFREV